MTTFLQLCEVSYRLCVGMDMPIIYPQLSMTTLSWLLDEIGSHFYLELVFEGIPATEPKAQVHKAIYVHTCMFVYVCYMYMWACEFSFFQNFVL